MRITSNHRPLQSSRMSKLFVFYTLLQFGVCYDSPVIGILTQPSESYEVDTLIAGSYVKFLEAAGARVLPIWLNQTADYYERVVNYTNGVLFPGGGAPFDTTGGYGEVAYKILHLAKEANDAGNFFPIWGTCLGMEVYPFAEIATDIRVNCNIPDGAYPLDFTGDFRKSRMFADLPNEIFEILLTQNVTYNAHMFCLTESTLNENRLDKDWKILTTNTDNNGLKFISAMENAKYPFYGIQFHPEKNAFEYKKDQGFPHSSDSVKMMQYFANFFVSETRKNKNTFPRRELEAESLIYNWCPQFTGLDNKYFYQIYGFEKEDYEKKLV